MVPPIRSAAATISSPLIFSVPRTSMICSMFEMPALSGVSVRVPIFTSSEYATTGAAAFSRTTTVRPLGRRARGGSFACSRNEGDARVRGRRQVLPCGVADLLLGNGAQLREIIQLVLQ